MIWNEYMQQEHHFNPIHFEWDLFRDNLALDESLEPVSLSLGAPSLKGLMDIEMASPEWTTKNDLKHIFSCPPESSMSSAETMHWEHISLVYYGMVESSGLAPSNYMKPTQRTIGIVCGKLVKDIAELKVPLAIFQRFFHALQNASTIADISPSLWLPLKDRNGFWNVIHNLGIQKIVLNSKMHYVVKPLNDASHYDFTLIIPHVRTVMLLAQMLWGEDISTWSIITSLVNDCCQFYTAILGPPPPKDFAVSSKEDLELLPWLPPKHQFTNLDLQNYIHHRNLFL